MHVRVCVRGVPDIYACGVPAARARHTLAGGSGPGTSTISCRHVCCIHSTVRFCVVYPFSDDTWCGLGSGQHGPQSSSHSRLGQTSGTRAENKSSQKRNGQKAARAVARLTRKMYTKQLMHERKTTNEWQGQSATQSFVPVPAGGWVISWIEFVCLNPPAFVLLPTGWLKFSISIKWWHEHMHSIELSGLVVHVVNVRINYIYSWASVWTFMYVYACFGYRVTRISIPSTA